MGKLKKSYFYYGAFLSALLNNGKAKPSLFDDVKKSSRRVYRFATEQSENDHIVFTKYVEGNGNEKAYRWTFLFTEDEITQLQTLNSQYGNVKVALICVKKNLSECELAIVEYDLAMKCLGINIGTRSTSITVKTYKGKHGLFVFGSGIDEDSREKISRDAIEKL